MGAAPSYQWASSSSSCAGDQPQSKRAPDPHMSGQIIAGEKVTDAAALEDEVCQGIFSCMLFARGMAITWGNDPRYWTWHPLKEGSDSDDSDSDCKIDVAALQNVCWLEIHGKQELSKLKPGVTYEVFFEVMLNDPCYGWSVPVNLQLKFPDGTIQRHKESLLEKPRGQWLQLKVGEVKTHKGQNGEVEISMFEYDGGHWKRGLLIKCIKIIQKE